MCLRLDLLGGSAPQWIEIDLGAPSQVAEVRLLVAQDPAGPTQHILLVQLDSGWQQVHVFSENMSDGQWLIFRPEAALDGVLQVRVETTASSNWVAWREISILGSKDTGRS